MAISDVQKLREMTGAGVMECKRALDEAGGNFDEAVKIIAAKGLANAEKRSGRTTGAGLIQAYVHNERVGALVEIRSETDFVAHSDPFRELAKNLAMQIAAMAPDDLESLMKEPFIKDASKTIKDLVSEVIAKVGENVQVGKFYRIEI